MRKITIGFSTPKDFKLGSSVIRGFEFGPKHILKPTAPSHVYVGMMPRLNSKLNFTKVFQASYGDVNCLKYSNFKADNIIFYEATIEVEDDVYWEVANWLWDQLQKPYAFNQLIKIGFGISIGDKGDDSYICTELAGRLIEKHLKFKIHKSLDYIGIAAMMDIVKGLEVRK